MSILKAIYRFMLKLVSPALDMRSSLCISRVKKRHDNVSPDRMRVAFLVFEPETWDKQEPVYEELLKHDDIQVDVVVVPSFNGSFSVGSSYGEERVFFEKTCERVVLAYNEHGELIDMSTDPYDYVFYGDSYNRHMPGSLRSYELVKHSKICYIPYGFSGSAVFDSIADNREFYRNVYFGFTDSFQKAESFKKAFSKNCSRGLQHFEYLGYPILERYLAAKKNVSKDAASVSWTPRWSYDKVIGGSHFLEYREDFLELGQKYNVDLTLRPHPMMFEEFSKKGLMPKDEIDRYLERLERRDVELSKNEPITDVLLRTDILITDYSSIIIMFFLTGRPIIYCEGSIPFNESFESLKAGMYIAQNWDEVDRHLRDILKGNDYLAETRRAIIRREFDGLKGSSERIVKRLCDDFYRRDM